MDVVGSAFGVVCLSHPPWGECIVLWNPATNQSTNVKLSRTRPFKGLNHRVSLGFGFDTDTLDCRVISIFCFMAELGISDRVEVYSSNNQCWKRLEVKPQFRVLGTRSSVVIKGLPYWRATVEDMLGPREVLVCFYVKEEEFHEFAMPVVSRGSCNRMVDLKDSVGIVVWEKMAKGSIDLWEMDEDNGWSKKFSVGLMFVEKVVWCSRKGDILVESGGVLLLYEIESGEMKCLSLANAESSCFEVFNYMESLVQIKDGGAFAHYHEKAEAGRRRLLGMGLDIKVCSPDPSRHNFLIQQVGN